MNSEMPILKEEPLKRVLINVEVVQQKDGTFELYCNTENGSGCKTMHLKTSKDIAEAFKYYLKAYCLEEN